MPVHRALVADLEKAVAEIEQTEQIIDIELVGDESALIVTAPAKRRAPGSKETR